jgi:hypothetical protein
LISCSIVGATADEAANFLPDFSLCASNDFGQNGESASNTGEAAGLGKAAKFDGAFACAIGISKIECGIITTRTWRFAR